jgi:hypothetical protein
VEINPRTFKGEGDIVKLNNLGLSYSEGYFENELFIISDIKVDLSDLDNCIKENGIEVARNCSCYLRYELSNTFHIINDIIFDEIDIVDLKENM